MTEVRDHFPDLDNLDVVQLHTRRDEILARAMGNYDSLDDDSLAELLQVTRCLRRKAASSGGAPKTRKPKTTATLDDLA